jgi:tripartite-type tricarboxylate transporter receptor subunit TctC
VAFAGHRVHQPRGNGTIGVAYVSRAAPDGYTLAANSLADAQNVHFVAVPYSPINDFAQIGWIVDGPPAVLVVNGALPYKTLADLIADAKKNPSKISFGTSGPASSPAMALAQLNEAAGFTSSACPTAARAKPRARSRPVRSRVCSRSTPRASR